MKQRSVSLSHELWTILQGVEGLRSLVEHIIQSPHDEGTAMSHSVASLLVALTERLRLLDRVVRGTVDARLILCPENEAFSPQKGDEPDVRLRAWSDRELRRHHKGEWRRAKRRLARSRAKESAP